MKETSGCIPHPYIFVKLFTGQRGMVNKSGYARTCFLIFPLPLDFGEMNFTLVHYGAKDKSTMKSVK